MARRRRWSFFMPALAVALLLLLSACSTTRVVRLDTGAGAPLEYKPPTWNEAVEVDAELFEEALTRLVLEAPLTLRSAPTGWLVRTSSSSATADTPWKRMCKAGQPREGCLSLLDDVMAERFLLKEERVGDRFDGPDRAAVVEHAVLRGPAQVRAVGPGESQTGSLVMELGKLVAEFARHVEAGTDAVWRGDSKAGSRHADRYIAAFKKLRAQGDAGRDALAVLLQHPRMDVRVTAATCLLRHRTREAKAVLEEAAQGEGMVAFEAQQALQRWVEGTWALDPA